MWLWRVGVLTIVGALAWFMRVTYMALRARIDKVESKSDNHEAEDRQRFDKILSELGKLRGQVDLIIRRLNGE